MLLWIGLRFAFAPWITITNAESPARFILNNVENLVEINIITERLITPCSHGGTPNYDEKRCECPPFFTGTLCEYSKQSVHVFQSKQISHLITCLGTKNVIAHLQIQCAKTTGFCITMKQKVVNIVIVNQDGRGQTVKMVMICNACLKSSSHAEIACLLVLSHAHSGFVLKDSDTSIYEILYGNFTIDMEYLEPSPSKFAEFTVTC